MKGLRLLFIAVLFLGGSFDALAQLPRGVFSLTPVGATIDSRVLSNQNVDGVSIRLHWSDLAPDCDPGGNPDSPCYHWDYLNTQIGNVTNGKSVSLRIGT